LPELPDLIVYKESLYRYITGRRLLEIVIVNPFVLRSVEPPLDSFTGKVVTCTELIGKRLVIGFEDDFFLVFHLMIAGRLTWKETKALPPRKICV
jgi:formamidopyrimidine-DNA glycosylase